MKGSITDFLTFHIIKSVSQHFKYGYIKRITEGFVVEMKTRIHLQRKQQKFTNKA